MTMAIMPAFKPFQSQVTKPCSEIENYPAWEPPSTKRLESVGSNSSTESESDIEMKDSGRGSEDSDSDSEDCEIENINCSKYVLAVEKALQTVKDKQMELLDVKMMNREVDLCNRIFFAIFELGIYEQCRVPKKSQIRIADMIDDLYLSLETCVDVNAGIFPRTSYVTSCKVRSGIEFMLEYFRNFAIVDDDPTYTLDEVLDKFVEECDLEIFDAQLNDWFPTECDAIENCSKELMDKIPKSHWWWDPKRAVQYYIDLCHGPEKMR